MSLEPRWTIADGLRLHFRYAPGPPDALPVVLVHGLVVSSRYMIPTAERLAERFPVYALDLLGFGASEKPRTTLRVPELANALRAFLYAERIGRAVLVGNSLGCQVIADLVARDPGLAECLVLNAPTVDPAARSVPRQIARLLVAELRERPSLYAIQLAGLLRSGLPRALLTARYMMADRIEEKLPTLRIPTLVVRGERDAVVPQRWAEEATRLLPHGLLAVIPGTAHATNYDAPDALAHVILRFLDRARPGR